MVYAVVGRRKYIETLRAPDSIYEDIEKYLLTHSRTNIEEKHPGILRLEDDIIRTRDEYRELAGEEKPGKRPHLAGMVGLSRKEWRMFKKLRSHIRDYRANHREKIDSRIYLKPLRA